MNKVEQVARAIMISRGGCDVTDWKEAERNPHVAAALLDARAAIEAMSEPTQYQLATGWAQLKRSGLPKLGPGPGLIEAYNAMIDAALTQSEGE